MANEHTIDLSCSFCGKTQREVRKLIAGPRVYICDECIGLCNQILGEELSKMGQRPPTPESARALTVGLVERQGNLCDLLGDIGRHAGEAMPEEVRSALMDLIVASRTLRDEVTSWSGGEKAASDVGEVSLWLRPCLERLGATVQALTALRPALEGLVPGVRLKVVDEAVSSISEVRGLLVTVAANEAREKGSA